MAYDLEQLTNRIAKLEQAVFGDTATKHAPAEKKKATLSPEKLSFSVNERAFVKRYAANKSGPKKFVLLLAYLTKGQIEKNVELGEVRKVWDKMSGKQLLGKFNRFYPNDAKTRGWIDSKEYGSYSLTSEWHLVL